MTSVAKLILLDKRQFKAILNLNSRKVLSLRGIEILRIED